LNIELLDKFVNDYPENFMQKYKIEFMKLEPVFKMKICLHIFREDIKAEVKQSILREWYWEALKLDLLVENSRFNINELMSLKDICDLSDSLHSIKDDVALKHYEMLCDFNIYVADCMTKNQTKRNDTFWKNVGKVAFPTLEA
jgi:hypothetical protein